MNSICPANVCVFSTKDSTWHCWVLMNECCGKDERCTYTETVFVYANSESYQTTSVKDQRYNMNSPFKFPISCRNYSG